MRQLFTLLLCLLLFDCSNKEKQVAASDTVSIEAPKTFQTDSSDIKTDELKKGVSRFTDYESYYQLDSYLVNTNQDTANFQTIDTTCAILIFPTEKQIELMQEEHGEDFYTIADDNSFYQSQAITFLDSLNIHTIIVGSKRYLKLIDENKKEWILDIRQNGAPGWNLIFFSSNKKPKVVPAIDVTNELIMGFYNH